MAMSYLLHVTAIIQRNYFYNRIPNCPPVLVLNCDREFHDDETVGKEMVDKVHSIVIFV